MAIGDFNQLLPVAGGYLGDIPTNYLQTGNQDGSSKTVQECTRFTAISDLAQNCGRTLWCSLYKRFHPWMHMQPEKSPLTKSLLSFTKSCQSIHALEAAFRLIQMVSLLAIAAEATVPSCAMM